MINTLIILERREIYGNKLLYVVSDQKDAIQTLTDKKTVDQKDITALKSLGFTVQLKSVEITF